MSTEELGMLEEIINNPTIQASLNDPPTTTESSTVIFPLVLPSVVRHEARINEVIDLTSLSETELQHRVNRLEEERNKMNLVLRWRKRRDEIDEAIMDIKGKHNFF